MRLLFERNDPQIYESNAQRAARMQTYMATATPELADKLGSARTTYNWVNPGILTSMVLSNNEPALNEVARVVGEKAFSRGISPSNGIRSRMTVQEQLAARQRTVNRLSGVTPTPETGRTTAPKEETPFGDDGRVNLFKALTTGFLSGVAFIPQVAGNILYQGMNYLPSGKSFKTQRNKSLIDQFLIGPVKQTYFGQLVQEGVSAAVSDEKASFKEIAGGGFFPGGKIVEDQARAAAQYRPLVGESQKPYTFGRGGGQSLVDLGITEEGSLLYNFVSGAIDLGVALRLDPTFGKPLKQPFGSRGPALSAVPGAVEEAQNMKKAAGVVEGTRKTVNKTQWDLWKNTPEAVDVAKPFVDEKDAATIWRNLGRQGIFTADNIAQATDHNGVITALENGVTELDDAVHVRNIPAGNLRPSADTGYKIKQSAQRFTNLFEVYPESTFIPNDNPNVAAKRLDDLMGLLGFDIETRNLWVNKWIATAREGTSKSFFEYLSGWEKTVLEDALIKNGVPKTEARQLAQWKNATVDVVNRWTLLDLADGAPPAWMDGGGLGPVRNTQLLKQGAYVVDPALLPEITKRLGKLYKLQAEADKLPAVAGWPISKVLNTAEVVGDTYGWFASEIWKPTVVAAVRYVTRIVPNEQTRVLLNQTFEHPAHYVLAIADGRFAGKLGVKGMYVADVFGETVNKSRALVELGEEILQTNIVIQQIDELVKAGDEAGAAILRNKYAKELADLPKKLLRQEELEQILDDGLPSLNEALIGQTPKAARESLVKNYGTGYYDRSGFSVVVSRNVVKEQQAWVKGIAQELADLHANPHYRVIAAGKMSDEEIAQYLFKGDGRRYFETYFKNFANLKEGYDWDTIENAREFVRVSKQEIFTVAGTNKQALDLIATGKFNGQAAFTLDKYKVRDAVDEVKTFIEGTLLDSADMPTHVRYRPRINMTSIAGEKGGLAKEKLDFVLDIFFKSLYGMPSDKLARSPAFRAGYWGRVEEVASLANKEAAQTLLENLAKANLPKPQADRIRLILSRADGVNDLEAIDDSARAFGLGYERKLLFDAKSKSRFGSQTKYIFDFFEAWREESSTWAKLMTEYPANGHKVDVALRALGGITDLGPGDINGDGKKEGFIYVDPQTGEQRVALRGTGPIGRAFANIPFGGFSMPLGSLTMFTTIGPGIGPLISFPSQYFIPSTKEWAWLDKMFNPYGRQAETGAQPVGGLLSLELTRPTWLKRMSPLAGDVFEKYAPKSFGQMMSDAISYIAGNPEESEAYKAFYNKTLQSKASMLESPPKTKKEVMKFFEDVEDATNKLYFLRGLGNFVLPGVPVASFMAESKQGPVELGVLADKMREYKKEAVEAGETETDGELRFYDVYGTQVWAIMGSIRDSSEYGGLVYSREFEDWFTKNDKFVNTYPEVAGYFGPQTEPGKWGPTEQNVYNRFIGRGIIKTQDPKELIKEAQSNVAYSVYDGVKSKMTLQQQNSKQGQEVLKTLREGLQEEFPEWDIALLAQESKSRRADQIKSLYEIINEPEVKGTVMGEAVAGYLATRDAQIETAFKAGVKGWNTDSKKSLPYRNNLYAVGQTLATAVPQFRPLWERVLSKEFVDPTVQE